MGYAEHSLKQRIREFSYAGHRIEPSGIHGWAGASRPVILDVENQSWAEEAAMVAEVSRRRYLNTFGDESIITQLSAHLAAGESAVVVTDHDSPLCTAESAHVIRLDRMVTGADSVSAGGVRSVGVSAGGVTSVGASSVGASAGGVSSGGVTTVGVRSGGASTGKGGSNEADSAGVGFEAAGVLELARLLRVGEAPVVAVSGSVGGAGASTLAFLVADALGETGMDSVLLDASPVSTGVDVALGVERVAGTRMADLHRDAELKRLPQVGFTRLLTQARDECVPVDLPECLRVTEESAVVVDCGRTDPHEPDRWQGKVPDAHVVVCPLTVAGVAAALVNRERTIDEGWPEPLYVLRQVPHSSATLALASVILDALPSVVIEDDPQLAKDIDSGQLENYINCYRDSPQIIAERAAQIPGAQPRSLRSGLQHARAFTERVLDNVERGAERGSERGRVGTQRVKRCAPHRAALEVLMVIQRQRASTHLDIEGLRLDATGKVA
ncbi:hypothetical protein [Corynebacterium auriscanis]|uniref:hypothetical protein n=1 Tax=Corynebacterium auriscanis TaxID=99807 RepID=UPI0022479D88|nr:hypothetical protein [Corynebacterium auriscanis]MCX2162598.1 hypothetical protein [Corynebacterium auriscanis]